ncbi:MAG: Asp-tRNA(Asn)/Glu-tRNA(Gln) amidotransferase subunit GatC [Puniceicoccales bacterium]|nr:Asp-tRNA(Asn)/Glu-tRNA(Gln) amidotransferase subunit GatC [Puniceicoccales bacterium]
MAEESVAGQRQCFDVAAIAAIAHLELTSDEMDSLGEQLGRIVAYVDRLKAIAFAENSEQFFDVTASLRNVYGADEVGDSFTQEEALSNAPESRDGQIVVPRIVEGD